LNNDFACVNEILQIRLKKSVHSMVAVVAYNQNEESITGSVSAIILAI
jgi:hypothetical protein